MIIFGVDQSISKFAVTVFEVSEETFEYRVIGKLMIRSGSLDAKKQLPDVRYFKTIHEQIEYITKTFAEYVKDFNAQYVFVEQLSFGSTGNATRDLAGLYYCLQQCVKDFTGLPFSKFGAIPPSSAKSLARDYLPIEDQIEEYVVKSGKDAGKTKTRKTVMKKKHMMKAVQQVIPDFIDGYTVNGKNSGAEDLPDSYFIGVCGINKLKKELHYD